MPQARQIKPPAKSSPLPTVDVRVRWLRIALLGATLSGMLCCLPLWLSKREYPVVPLMAAWPALPSSFGPLFLGVALLSLVAAVRWFRPAVIFFLLAILYLWACDQNRGQPWLYLYWVMLLLNLLPERTALAACRLALSLAYLWAGAQKLNGTFFRAIPPWFCEPALHWGLPDAVVAAFWELFIGAGVWFGKTRWPALALAAVLHGASLLFLGPFGHNLNAVVWPWNLAMVVLLYILFGAKEHASLPQTLRETRRSWAGAAGVGLFGLLPVLSYFGWWDSYFSFALYSANVARADVYVTQGFKNRLPVRLRMYVHPVENFNPHFQLPFTFEHERWAAAQLRVPPIPEPREFVVMFRRLAIYATNDADCRMVVETRGGEILIYQPRKMEPLVVNP